MCKNPVFGLLCLYKGFYYVFVLKNKEFNCLLRVYGKNILIALQFLNVDGFEDGGLSTKFSAETRGDMEKLMPCVGH